MRDDPAFSRKIAVADLPRRGKDFRIEASADELAEIARRFNLPAVEALSGTYHVGPAARGARVRGEVRARLSQTCIVSLQPFEAEIREPVDVAFAAPLEQSGTSDAAGKEISISPDDEDPPEPLIGGKIDLGAVTLEFLALGIDPYPRKPGIEFAPRLVEDADEKPPSPFAALKALRQKGEGEG